MEKDGNVKKNYKKAPLNSAGLSRWYAILHNLTISMNICLLFIFLFFGGIIIKNFATQF